MDSVDGPLTHAWSGMPRRLLNMFALVLLVRFILFLYKGFRVRARFRQLQKEGIVSSCACHHGFGVESGY